MRFSEIVQASNQVAAVSGRLEKIERLASVLQRLAPDDIEIAIAFLSGSLRQGRVGIGPAVIWQANEIAPAESPSLELRDVDAAFERIAGVGGAGATAERRRLLRELTAHATREEQDFLARLLFGELRQGAQEGVVVEAVARASGVTSDLIRRAAMMTGDLGSVARAAILEGESSLSRYVVQIFRPVQPMLADSATDVDAALGALGEASLEYKIDGARIQVHKSGGEVRIYSRTTRDVTRVAPEIAQVVRALPARELILDGEVIALRHDGTPHPFQVTMSRFGRKLDVDRFGAELPLSAFFFDCLLVDGRPLIDEPQSDRFGALVDLAPSDIVIPYIVAARPDQAVDFLNDALRHGHEGLMAKARAAGYAAGRRGKSWLKIKVARTLDLVVLAAEWGHGRRRGWLSNLHLGARDPDRHSFVMLGKTFKGLTDEMLAWQTARLLELEIGRDDDTVYVRPELVVEVAFNEVQVSPQYPGGVVLRFARVKRYRTDKTAGEADTIETVRGSGIGVRDSGFGIR
ncbi:MAG: ATP-dependent DNA ligase [Acidobacteria bacterium]|nr:ATP-dependent DNA ligase [Acidobacteriota bacterium]